MSSTVKIFHYENEEEAIQAVKSYIISINGEYKTFNIEISYLEFYKRIDFIKEITEKNNTPDIILLDMYDENFSTAGEDILAILKNHNLNIPTIIYTTGCGTNAQRIDYDLLRRTYVSIYGKEIIKSKNGNELKDRIKEIIDDRYIPNNIDSLFIKDEDDIFLKASIRSIKEQNFNRILLRIKRYFNDDHKSNIEHISSGFSGAAIFKLCHDNKTYVLKISNDKNSLKEEYESGKNLYKQFPSKLRIDVHDTPFEVGETYAILIEYVHNATTLFNWLHKSKNQNDIENYFEKLYSASNGLAYFYGKNDDKEKVKFTHIFETFKSNYAPVATSVKELDPIINCCKNEFSEDRIKGLVLNGLYVNIDKNNLTGDKYLKHKVLCHGDFHSNNIMVQGNDPIIIDTGGIKYDYWCMDICRLIIHLFIVGYDKGRYQYFDVSEISNNIEIVKEIIALKKLSPDGINDGYIYAINWLIENVEKIYTGLYCKWEFQLGLCKEFLQMSYRINSAPPNKRAIALLSAYECMLQANKSIQADESKK